MKFRESHMFPLLIPHITGMPTTQLKSLLENDKDQKEIEEEFLEWLNKQKRKIDLDDLAVIFYTKIARWSEDSLIEKINNSFIVWIKELHIDADKMRQEMTSEEKMEVEEIVKELKKGLKNV